MKSLYKQVALFVGYFLLAILACRLTHGMAMLVIAVIGAIYGVSGRHGHALVAFLTIPFLMSINPLLIPRYGGLAFYSRISFLVLSGVIIAVGLSVKSRVTLPLLGLFLYLFFSFFSSLQGWFPLISAFKIVNFTLFIVTIYAASKLIFTNEQAARYCRVAILALCIIYIYGSLLTLPFPAMAYLTTLSRTVVDEGLAAAEEVFRSRESGMFLFCGITSQSQLLGPLLACLAPWLLCDALLVERRIPLFHWVLLAPIPVLLFLTRSRLALLVFVFSITVVVFFCLPRARMNRIARGKVLRIGLALFLVILAMGTISEIRGQKLTKWIRKTDQIQEDSRSAVEALTESRQGVIGRCLEEFERNPLLGSGFQVIKEHPRYYKLGYISLFSAPIEKGLLPLMVLGESGVIGSLIFLGFLFFFFYVCYNNQLYATITLFLAYLMTNMAEATFFSPSGVGGLEWLVLVMGGFAIDCSAKSRTIPLCPHPVVRHDERRRTAKRKHRRSRSPFEVPRGRLSPCDSDHGNVKRGAMNEVDHD